MTGTRRPVLVVPTGAVSVPALNVAEAAATVCDLLWLVWSDDREPVSTPLLRRLGSVVDLAGKAPDEIASAVAEHAPDGITAFRDRDLVPMADLAERLGLPFHTPAVARRMADKWEQRRALAEAGVPVPEVWSLPDVSNPLATAVLARRLRYPVVVKPRWGADSRHTFRIGEPSELVALARWLDGETGGSEEMIVEEYLADRPKANDRPVGGYVSVETVADHSGVHHVAVTGRLRPAAEFRETGFFTPAELTADDQEAVLLTASRALQALGFQSGCAHTEIKLTPDGPRVIEVNGRLGGGIAELVRLASGTDLLRSSFRAAVGLPSGLTGLVECRRVGYRLYLQSPTSARVVTALDGLAALRDLPGVEDVHVWRVPGDLVDPVKGTGSGAVLVLAGTARDVEEVLTTNERMYERAGVTFEHRLPLRPQGVVA